MFEVMMMMVFLKSTVLPKPSVSWPSSKTCKRMLKTSGALSRFRPAALPNMGAFDAFGQLSAFFVAYVSGRRADEFGDAVLLHEFGHIEAD